MIEPLSDEERRALTIAAQGFTLAAGAKRFGKGKRTYQRILSDAQTKLGANSHINAVAIAVTLRLITVPPPGGPR